MCPFWSKICLMWFFNIWIQCTFFTINHPWWLLGTIRFFWKMDNNLRWGQISQNNWTSKLVPNDYFNHLQDSQDFFLCHLVGITWKYTKVQNNLFMLNNVNTISFMMFMERSTIDLYTFGIKILLIMTFANH